MIPVYRYKNNSAVADDNDNHFYETSENDIFDITGAIEQESGVWMSNKELQQHDKVLACNVAQFIHQFVDVPFDRMVSFIETYITGDKYRPPADLPTGITSKPERESEIGKGFYKFHVAKVDQLLTPYKPKVEEES